MLYILIFMLNRLFWGRSVLNQSGEQAFAQLIDRLRLQVELYHNAKICGQWQVHEHDLGNTCFHMATEGGCYLEVPGHLQTELNTGDVVIFPRELPHIMCPVASDQSRLVGPQQHLPYKEASTREGVGMLCGTVHFQHQSSSELLDALPPVFIVRASGEKCRWWCDSLLSMILAESYQPTIASQVLLNRLSELLFLFALRQFICDSPQQVGLLALYQDKTLMPVVAAIQKQPDLHWTLESMANIALMSRSKFAQIFRQVSGWTAMQFVTWWRMQLAWDQLQQGDSVSTVSEAVGYQSETAFSNAFLQHFKRRPGAIRRGK